MNPKKPRATLSLPTAETRDEGYVRSQLSGPRARRAAEKRALAPAAPASTPAPTTASAPTSARGKSNSPTGATPSTPRPPARRARTGAPDTSAAKPAYSPSRPARPPQAPAPVAATAVDADSHDGLIRLSKLMSQQGIASRREADEWIAKGWVRVDDVVIKELGSRVKPDQKITIDKSAKEEQRARVTILLNKPVGYVSGQAEDGHLPASVLFVAANRWEQDEAPQRFHPMQAKGLAPAGRLDIDSVGLIVFTQDGRIAKQLIGDNSEVEKEYLVRVAGTLAPADLKRLHHGLELDGEALRPAKVSWQNEDQLRFVLREGKKRQIRRMCELVGLKVLGLKRIRIGKISLGELPPGKWRYLSPQESFA
ncbi:MAG: rRNA pseudouridine synthase [Betaproteobacteria bacterium]|nr:rRNA pseudouridine synthase [Betaproteobacteria bacterium]